jgi:DNA-binding transcriptional LysR family regulator
MELRHLRYFVAVAETGNLSRAAEKLFIAQPPLSVQIRQLEDEMGTPLFVRHPKGVRLTAAGEALLPEARLLLDRAAHIKELLSSTGSAGHLSLGYRAFGQQHRAARSAAQAPREQPACASNCAR